MFVVLVATTYRSQAEGDGFYSQGQHPDFAIMVKTISPQNLPIGNAFVRRYKKQQNNLLLFSPFFINTIAYY